MRVTPFSFADILLLSSVFPIWHHYISVPGLVAIIFAIILIVFLCVKLFKISKKHKAVKFLHMLATEMVVVATCIVGATILINLKVLARNFGNLADSYHDYGLVYCFTNSVVNMGISKPSNYSSQAVNEIVSEIDTQEDEEKTQTVTTTASTEKTDQVQVATTVTDTNAQTQASIKIEDGKVNGRQVNIIFLQLESFFDPETIVGAQFSSDPLPNYRKLLESCTSGFLDVPVVGAGTCNTEFEAITGLDLDFFGPGEYPYKTVLMDNTCESAPYILKGMGYSTHAIHDNNASFYGRNTVFKNLGFDTFTSIEYMNDVEYTPMNWAKDNCLTAQISDALKSSEGADYIYTISVQGHGAYPTQDTLSNPEITITLPEGYSDETYYGLLYYVNEIHEMDEFIGELTSYLEGYDEPVVLVMYGDHLPGFSFTPEELTNNNIYQTQYCMWSNFSMGIAHEEKEAFQLYSYVFDRLDIHEGLINMFHQSEEGLTTYLDDLKMLEYDMLYGDKDCYNGVNPYSPTDLQMGVKEISINSVKCFAQNNVTDAKTADDGDNYVMFVYGENFTPYSTIYVNGEELNTMFVSDNVISATCSMPAHNDMITVAQVGEDGNILSETDGFVVTKEVLLNMLQGPNPYVSDKNNDDAITTAVPTAAPTAAPTAVPTGKS